MMMSFYEYEDWEERERVRIFTVNLSEGVMEGRILETCHHVGDTSQGCIVVFTRQQPTSNVVEE